MSYPHRFYAIVIPGLEAVAAKELERLSAHEIKPDHGGVHFSGTMETMFRVNLRSRVITRVLMRLKRFTAMTLDEIKNHSERIDWSQFLSEASSISVHASCHKSKLMHSKMVEDQILEVIKRFGCCTKEKQIDQQVFIRIENNRCLLSIDTTGERLDRRGYRLESGKAPLRETMAAAVLQWMEWSPDEPLMVPMCGSGTFAIEAALMATRRSPGLIHQFPFLMWPSLKQKSWKRSLKKSEEMMQKASEPALIHASDINASAIEITRRNAERAGVEELLQLQQTDIRMLGVPENMTAGLIVINPPYGKRIDADVRALYAAIGELKRRFPGWRMAVISSSQSCERALGSPFKKRLKTKHGGNWVHILEF